MYKSTCEEEMQVQLCACTVNTGTIRYLQNMSLVRSVLEYGAWCWDPYREGQTNALDRV